MKTLNPLLACKKVIILFFALFFITSGNLVKSQERKFAVYPTFGFGFGFFYPGDVNDYISNEMYRSSGSVTYQTSNTDIFMNMLANLGLTFRMKRFDITPGIEGVTAPKFASNGDTYSFRRTTGSLIANYYIPMGRSGKYALFAGGGVNYSRLKFEEFSDETPGFRLQFGGSFQFGSLNFQPHIAYNNIKGTSKEAYYSNETQKLEFLDLNYSGVQIGFQFSIHRRMSYR